MGKCLLISASFDKQQKISKFINQKICRLYNSLHQYFSGTQSFISCFWYSVSCGKSKILLLNFNSDDRPRAVYPRVRSHLREYCIGGAGCGVSRLSAVDGQIPPPELFASQEAESKILSPFRAPKHISNVRDVFL